MDIVLAAVNARRPRPVDNQNKNLERYTHAVWLSLLYPTPKSYVKSWGSVEFFFCGEGSGHGVWMGDAGTATGLAWWDGDGDDFHSRIGL